MLIGIKIGWQAMFIYLNPGLRTLYLTCQVQSSLVLKMTEPMILLWNNPVFELTRKMMVSLNFCFEVSMETAYQYSRLWGSTVCISLQFYFQDMIAIPDFSAGAMENWGLITYRETAMLFEPGVSSEGNRQRVVSVITHELAHQVKLEKNN